MQLGVRGRLPAKIHEAYIKAVSRQEVVVTGSAHEANRLEIVEASTAASPKGKVMKEKRGQSSFSTSPQDALSKDSDLLYERSQFSRIVTLEGISRRPIMTLQDIKKRIKQIKELKETSSVSTQARQAKENLYTDVIAALAKNHMSDEQERAFVSAARQAEEIVPN